MKVVILCGGFGTRIRDVASDVPKPMIPIGQFPILWHIMKYYACWEQRQFVLCLGHRREFIKEFFLNYPAHTRDFTVTLGHEMNVRYHTMHEEDGWEVTLAETGRNAMTGARVQRIKQYVEHDDDFMLTYGDGVTNLNIDELIAFHRNHGKILTVSGVSAPGRFGELDIAVGDLAVGFNEKPEVSQGRVSGGFFVCKSKIFDYLDDREDLVLEQEPFRELVREGQMIVYRHDGFWHPMDTHRDYRHLNELWDAGEAPWKIW